MDVRQLRYFMAVAEERHITRAAEKLGIQQPPLSRFIKNIEAELDVRLFTRTPRGVELTEAGQAFRDEAGKVLAGLENAIEVTRARRGASVDAFASASRQRDLLLPWCRASCMSSGRHSRV